AQQVDDFLTTRFTGQDLYQWMAGQISTLYFQAFQLACGLAQQCQAAFQFETGGSQTFLSGGYWDDLHKGLLAAEGLMLDLQRMEKAFLDANVRRFEIQKVISFKRDLPQALFDLNESGKCLFSLDAAGFEGDFPGHIQRQIKSVSVSFPA